MLYYEYEAVTFQGMLLCHKVQTSAFYTSSRPLCYMRSLLIIGCQLYVVYKVHHKGFCGHTFQVTPTQFIRVELQLSIEEERLVALVSFTSPNYIVLPLVFFYLTFLTTCY